MATLTPPRAPATRTDTEAGEGSTTGVPHLLRPDAPRDPLHHRLGAGARAWVQLHRKSLLVAGPVLFLAAVVHGVGMGDAPLRFEDEGTYIAQAWTAQTGRGLTHYTYWYDHPPLGWIQLSLWTKLTGGFWRNTPLMAGREFMFLVAMASAVLVFMLGRRLGFRRGTAALAMAAFSLSPLAVHFQRMVFLDNVAIMWLLASWVLALDRKGRLWAFAASGACLAIAVLSKETVLLFAPVIAWTVLRNAPRETRRYCVSAFAVVAGILVLAYPLWATLRGELLTGSGHVSLQQAIDFQLASRRGSGSPFVHGTPSFDTVNSWLSIDSWLVVTGALLAPVAIFFRRLWPLAVAVAIQLLMLVRPSGYLPIPFVLALLPFSALLIGGVADELITLATRRRTERGGAGRSALQPVMRWGAAGLLALGAIGALGATRSWAAGDHGLMTTRADAPAEEALGWMKANVSRDQRVLVDDSYWLDLVQAGWNPHYDVIWFPKVDLDPAVAKHLPQGWHDIRWVISTRTMRDTLDQLPTMRAALSHSDVRAVFGSGPDRIEIREVQQ